MKKKLSDINVPDRGQVCHFLDSIGKPVKIEAILQNFGLGKSDKNEIKKMLQELAQTSHALRISGDTWASPSAVQTLLGAIQFTATDTIKFIPENGTEEISLTREEAGDAWDQDYVRIALIPNHVPQKGYVLEILNRPHPEVAVRFIRKEGKNLICRSTGRRYPVFFTVHMEDKTTRAKFKPGQLLAVRPVKSQRNGNWIATLAHSYTNENALATQEALVKLNHDVPGAFPALALEQAKKLPETPAKIDYANREDLRHLNFVTIDGADARDFDDAVQVERTDDGWMLRVAIADVSHYVPIDNHPDSLDGEALRRGNSWYFPKSVEPMLPEKISNGLCSLKPDEERLAMLAEMEFSKKGTIKATRFAPVVIRSKARLTYDEAGDFFKGNQTAVPHKVASMLSEALQLYKLLRKNRQKRGNLDFDLPEAEYSFDEYGTLKDIKHAKRNDAHGLIEEFMIAANEAVASWLEKHKVIFPFRVHPVPEDLKLAGLLETLKKIAPEILPHNVSAEDLAHPETIQKILERAKGTPFEFVVNRLCLRSMSQARYQAENIGHFALASPSYCHFTSPIRRYADLLVHRAVKTCLKLLPKDALPDAETITDITGQLNKLERNAIDCEREMAKRLACLLLAQKEGAVYHGSISGVTEFGLFVELKEIPAEGIIKTRELGWDWFELDAERQMLIGRKTKKTYQLGQAVKVKILGIDEDRLEVRLALADNKEKSPQKIKKRRRSFENEKKKNKNDFVKERKENNSGRRSSHNKLRHSGRIRSK